MNNDNVHSLHAMTKSSADFVTGSFSAAIQYFSFDLFQANERKVVSIQADDPIAFMQLLETAENEILEVGVCIIFSFSY